MLVYMYFAQYAIITIKGSLELLSKGLRNNLWGSYFPAWGSMPPDVVRYPQNLLSLKPEPSYFCRSFSAP